jgi:hypothetical protein
VQGNRTAPHGYTAFSYRWDANRDAVREHVRERLKLRPLPQPPRLRIVGGRNA